MKYFLSIDNNYYHRWQAELLIESFKYHSLNKDLFIFITNKDALTSNGYNKNLLSHKNKYFHDSIDDYLNKLNSLKYLKLNLVKEDAICILQPDMLLYNKINFPIESDIITSYDPSLKDRILNTINKEFSNLIKNLDYYPKFPPCGEIVIINDKDISFINNLIYYYKKLDLNKSDLNKEGCYILSIIKEHYLNNKTLKIEALEQNLMHHNLNNNFINYKHGVGSIWNKHQFKRPDILLGMSGPYDSFINIEVTTSSIEYMKEIVRNYLSDL